MKTLGTYIIVIPVEHKESVSPSGLQFTSKQNSAFYFQEGIIHSVGLDVSDKRLKNGERILYRHGKGHDIRISDNMYRALDERDCAIILDEGEII